VCQCPKFLVASIYDLPDVINCQVREFAAALLAVGTRTFSVAGPTVWNSLPDHLRDPAVDPEQFRRDLRRFCSPDIRIISALEVLRNRALQIDMYLIRPTYVL